MTQNRETGISLLQPQSLLNWLEQRWVAVTAVLMLLACGIRSMYIGEASFFLDEAFSVFVAQQSLGDLLRRMSQDPNPPLYFLLLKGWMMLVGDDQAPVRLLSVLISACSIPLVMQIGRRHFNFLTGLMAALLLTFSNGHLQYSMEARTYALTSFLTLCSIWHLLNLLETGSWKHALWLALFNALLLHSHYAVVFLLPMEGLAALIYLRRTPGLFTKIAASLALSVLLFLPWALYFWQHKPENPGWIPPPDWNQLKYTFITLHGEIRLFVGMAAALLAALAIAVAGVFLGVLDGRKLAVLLLLSVGSFGAAWVFSMVVSPLIQPNYVLYMTLAFFLTAGYGLSALPRGWGLIPAAAMALLALVSMHTHVQKQENWKEGVEAARREKDFTPRSAVFVCVYYEYYSFAYYYNRTLFRNYPATDGLLKNEHVYPAWDGNVGELQLANEWEKIISVECQCPRTENPEKDLHQVMEKRFAHERTYDFGELKVHVYRNDSARALPPPAAPADSTAQQPG